jgi:hypothetical protein
MVPSVAGRAAAAHVQAVIGCRNCWPVLSSAPAVSRRLSVRDRVSRQASRGLLQLYVLPRCEGEQSAIDCSIASPRRKWLRRTARETRSDKMTPSRRDGIIQVVFRREWRTSVALHQRTDGGRVVSGISRRRCRLGSERLRLRVDAQEGSVGTVSAVIANM